MSFSRHNFFPHLLIAIAILVAGALSAVSAQDATTEDFAQRSLQYRTALHYDPMLEQPLDALVTLYNEAERTDELIGLYRSHVEKYPNDAGAKAVLFRLMEVTGKPDAGEFLASAISLHPESAALNYLLFHALQGKGDVRAAEALSRAIDFETNPARRGQWLDELLQISGDDAGRAFASEQIAKVLANESHTAGFLLDLALLCQRYGFWEESIEALKLSLNKGLDAEGEIEAEVRLAKAEAQLGRGEAAGKILDQVLKKLSLDHWRRREIMTLRVAVIADDDERARILDRYREAFEQNPKNPGAALDYAEILVAGEKRDEAVQVLQTAAEIVVAGSPGEARAIALMEAVAAPIAYAAFLDTLLEKDPDRPDLRFRSVKANYALGRDADAEQDLRVVIAGLDEDQVSDRILELQRFLRGIDRIDAAVMYLERYVRDHPDRLDIARELAEVEIKLEQRAAVDALAGRLDSASAPIDEVIDLASYLLDQHFALAARKILEAKLSAGESSFELGLLQIRILGELGLESETTAAVAKWREAADSSERYAQWLDATVEANRKLETLERFFDNEQARFTFTNKTWPPDKVEKFVLLCEAGNRGMLGSRVADSIRSQLSSATFDNALRVRLRRFLVGILGNDPAAANEIEIQLRALETEDSTRKIEYELRRALLYDATGRVDLAQQLLLGADLSKVEDAELVQQAVTILVEYGYLEEAESALAALNELSPENVFAWEKRLTLLAFLGRETDFRALVRELRNGATGLELREDTIASLDRHLTGSYWRSIARAVASGDRLKLEDSLPLLAAVDREARPSDDAAWSEWTRAEVLRTLDRREEAAGALDRLNGIATARRTDVIRFPDGLELTLKGALEAPTPNPATTPPVIGDAGFLAGAPSVAWMFRPAPGTRIERFAVTGEMIVAIDDQGATYGIDAETGKLAWTVSTSSGALGAIGNPKAFFLGGDTPGLVKDEISLGVVKRARPFAATGQHFYLIENEVLRSRNLADGTVAWEAPLPFDSLPEATFGVIGAAPDIRFTLAEGFIAVFRPSDSATAVFEGETGRLAWSLDGGEVNPGATSMNSGIDASSGLLFCYGSESVVRRLGTGNLVWKFAAAEKLTFPPVLRRAREPENSTNETISGDTLVEKPQEARRILVDFLENHEDSGSSSFRLIDSVSGSAATMVNPAVFWAENRLEDREASYARISDGFLWLMQSGSLRRISVRLPAASVELSATGTFLGTVGSHAWFLEKGHLQHLDFEREKTRAIDCSDLGLSLRATRSGSQIVVMGPSGLRIFNARTGSVVGSGSWPEALASAIVAGDSREEAPVLAWQGVADVADGGPRYCYPIDDSISTDRFVGKLSEDLLICLVPGNSEPAQTAPAASPSKSVPER